MNHPCHRITHEAMAWLAPAHGFADRAEDQA